MGRQASESSVGGRVRALRRAAGMTQVDLAAGRFTKQYVSQIERGEVEPSGELLDWLAGRLGVDRMQLETGLGTAELGRLEAELERGEEALRDHRHAEALATFAAVRQSLPPGAPRRLHRSALAGETWALVRLGRIAEAAAIVGAGPTGAGEPERTLDEQAELAYLAAICRYAGSEISAAQTAFGRALDLLDSAPEPNDRLRLDIHQWRSRCYRRLRDWEAAREDIDRALELCDASNDDHRRAEVHLQASLVAERQGRWVLARRYAETALALFGQVGDTATRGRVLNNLAGLNHSLGDDDAAIAHLNEAFAIFVEVDLRVEAGYVLSSLAEIHRGRGELEQAETAASRALEHLEGRVDHIQEIGTAQLVLARSRLEQGDLDTAERVLAGVDESFARTESISHQARSWMTRAELELLRRNDAEAARLYRAAATALQPPDL